MASNPSSNTGTISQDRGSVSANGLGGTARRLSVAKGLRVAIVHDWLTGYRGGEKVLEAICEMFPAAPLYTLVHKKGSLPANLESREIRTSWLQSLPLATTHYRHYLPLFPLAAETLLGAEEYDLVISTSHAVAKSVRTGGARHWCYIHSPMRYVWDRFDDYFGAERVGTLASSVLFAPVASILRWYDQSTASRVDQFVANSTFVADRVRSFYDRESEVIAPPVEVERFATVRRDPRDYYLFFSALVPYKKADHAILACQQAQRKLVVLGDGPELPRLKKIADPKWIEFAGSPANQTVLDHYSRARALIFPAVEDFGIVPVEATAAGLPLIGLRAGGLLDSQTNETCQFYNEQTVSALQSAIHVFESRPNSFNTDVLRSHSQKFSGGIFREAVEASLQRFLSLNNTKLGS